MSVSATWLLLPLLARLASAGGSSADHELAPVTGPISTELEAYRAARIRFADRMREVEDDTRALVSASEDQARGRVDARYQQLISDLEATGRDQREDAIGRFEAFLQKYPKLRYADHVRFRLAELWYEKATEDWLAATAAQDAEEGGGASPKRDLARPLALYRQIIDQNRSKTAADRYERLDGTYLMLAFVYMDPNAAQHDAKAAQHAFLDLIDQLPQSELADRAHLYLGNFAFDRNDFDAALAEYQQVIDKGTIGKYYEEALYQLAWAKYKLDQFDSALALFSELLGRSAQTDADTGKESAFAPDARRFMAFSLADIAYDTDQQAVDVARAYFGDRAPPYERQVYEELADVLQRYTRPREAIAVYDLLQLDPRWRNAEDNPTLQIATIELYLNSVIRDLEAAGEARVQFIERYGEGSDWWIANRDDPQALDVARTFIESSLLEVAVEYRVRAQESGNVGDYALAAAKYREYLDRFPIADDFYEQQWYLADSLKLARDWDGARVEYESLLRNADYHPFGDGAVYSLMDIELQAMLAAGHAPDAAPTDADVERSYAVGGAKVDVYALTRDRQRFVDAARRVLSHPFAARAPVAEEAGTEAPPVELPDYAAEVEQRRPAIAYLIGQILHYHHRYDESRAEFLALIDGHPRSMEANYAAGLLVDSFLAEGNLEQVRAFTKRFTVDPPGPPSKVDPKRFSGTLEGTTFQLAMDEAEHGDALRAAERFLAFGDEFPDSELAKDALFNAAFYHQQVGRAERANELYEAFVAQYPQDERSKGLFFRIAANYESTFDLERAVTFYDKILEHRAATLAEKADAQYNRSFLMIGLGRNEQAARGFELYDQKYPAQSDREKVMFLAGEQWEQVGTAQALAFYERYRRRYPSQNPDHVIEADYKIAALRAELGAAPEKVRDQRKAVLADFDRFVAGGQTLGPKGHEYAAKTGLLDVQQAYDSLAKLTLTGNDAKDVKILDAAQARLVSLEEDVKAFVGKYQDFASNSRALYLQARGALALADLGLSIHCPAGMSEEDCWLFEDVLQENVFPKFYAVEEVGIQRLQELVAAATEKKRHSEAIDAAMAELNRRRPADFPAVKAEVEGATRPVSGVAPPPRPFPTAPAPADGGSTP